MLLTITTTHNPATDLGFLFHKHPNRCQRVSLSFGDVYTFFPEASFNRCTMAILLDMSPVNLIRRDHNIFGVEQYVNDRPYTCSSFMSVILSKVFGQTLNGTCKQKPELAEQKIPLECQLSVIPCHGGETFLKKIFEPLGYLMSIQRHLLDESFPDWGESFYYTVILKQTVRLYELLNHLYVLIPVLDNQKHYYIDEKEIEKLLSKGQGWLTSHPEKEVITRRYLKYNKSFAREALERLMETETLDSSVVDCDSDSECGLERPLNLNDERMGTVISVLKGKDIKSVLDLGCGEGKFLKLLLKEKQFSNILGVDVSVKALEIAKERLNLERLSEREKERIRLIHGSLMYRDQRFCGYDAACILEVIEHLDISRLKAFEKVLFQYTSPKIIVLTTPNREYNVFFENMKPGNFRHPDHRFEWTRSELKEWALKMGESFGYETDFLSIGKEEKDIGSPTQMVIFSKKEG